MSAYDFICKTAQRWLFCTLRKIGVFYWAVYDSYYYYKWNSRIPLNRRPQFSAKCNKIISERSYIYNLMQTSLLKLRKYEYFIQKLKPYIYLGTYNKWIMYIAEEAKKKDHSGATANFNARMIYLDTTVLGIGYNCEIRTRKSQYWDSWDN